MEPRAPFGKAPRILRLTRRALTRGTAPRDDGAGVREGTPRSKPCEIHPMLRRDAVGRPPRGGPLWPFVIIVATALYALVAAEVRGSEGWPLWVLSALPILALGYDAFLRRTGYSGRTGRSSSHRRCGCRIRADRRPVLLRPVLLLGEPRPARIIGHVAAIEHRDGVAVPGLGGRVGPGRRGGRGRILRRLASAHN